MKATFRYTKVLLVFIAVSGFAQVTQFVVESAKTDTYTEIEFKEFSPELALKAPDPDTPEKKLKFPLNKDKKPGEGKSHSLDLDDPSVLNKTTTYDTATGKFITTRSIGDSTDFGDPEYQDLDEYLRTSNDDYLKNYFKTRAKAQVLPTDTDPFDKLFKGNLGELDLEEFVDIKPQGSAELIFMGEYNKVENPAWSVRTQRTGQFKFDQKIRLNVLGKIGDKINLNLNFDTEANFEFDNQIKLNWQGKEDDIVKSIEAGNISLPVQGSLINGSNNLFGLKSTMQFGRLTVTGVVSR